jgi:hypothetical protein
MTSDLIAEPLRPVEALNALIARHGPLRVILALPAALLLRRRERPAMWHDLSPHLQRDIGIPPDRTGGWGMR